MLLNTKLEQTVRPTRSEFVLKCRLVLGDGEKYVVNNVVKNGLVLESPRRPLQLW